MPIRGILHKPDLAGRMTSWSVELSKFDIIYKGRMAIKSQALVDFLVKMIPTAKPYLNSSSSLWVDGASNLRGGGAGVVLEGPNGVVLEQSLCFDFKVSNNQAEYEALIVGLRLAIDLGVEPVVAKSDSQLLTNQFSGDYQVKDPQLSKYMNLVQSLKCRLQDFAIEHVPKE